MALHADLVTVAVLTAVPHRHEEHLTEDVRLRSLGHDPRELGPP